VPAPVKLTPQVEHALCDLVREGIPLVDAGRALGLGERTVQRWAAAGRERNGRLSVYRRFAESLAAAEFERQEHVRDVIAFARKRAR
jgi:hypothetical protein